MRRRLIFTLWSLLLLITLHLTASSQESKFSIRVELNITAEDAIKNEVTSYLSRELRSLGDVVITDNDPHLRIRVIALRNYSGYILSVVVTNPLINAMREILLSKHDEKQKAVWLDILADEENIVNNFVRLGTELQLACNEVVASIDSENLEPERKEWQKGQEILKRARQKRKQ